LVPSVSASYPDLTAKETYMVEGTLIAESLRVGTNLENPKLTVRRISRLRLGNTTADQPEIWTLLDFEADEWLSCGRLGAARSSIRCSG
jgi:hypothetical protein